LNTPAKGVPDKSHVDQHWQQHTRPFLSKDAFKTAGQATHQSSCRGRHKTLDSIDLQNNKSDLSSQGSPMVVMWLLRTCWSVNWEMRQVFPTPLSPQRRTLNR